VILLILTPFTINKENYIIIFYFFRFLIYNVTMKKEKLEKLILACSAGRDIKNACQWAGVTSEEFIEHCRVNVGFSDYCESLKENPVTEAMITLSGGIKSDPDLALKYLERKKKDEFSLRTEFTGKDGKDLLPVPILNGIADDNKS